MRGIVEVWPATDSLQEHLPRLSDQALALPVVIDGSCEVDLHTLHLGERRVTILQSFAVEPHVDDFFCEWTALWILSANAHVMGIADSQPKYPGDWIRRPAKKRSTMIPLIDGQIVLFNAHRTHWMDRAPDSSLMVAASYDFKERPAREDVEGRIAIDLLSMPAAAVCGRGAALEKADAAN